MDDKDQIITGRPSPEIESDAIEAGKWVFVSIGAMLVVSLLMAMCVRAVVDIDRRDDAEMRRTGMPCNSVLMDRAWGAGIACREEAVRRGLIPRQ